jgi:GxxExxY protein
MKTKKNLIYADECYHLMGIIFKVFKKLGFGHKESFYQKALAEEFKDNDINFKEQLR